MYQGFQAWAHLDDEIFSEEPKSDIREVICFDDAGELFSIVKERNTPKHNHQLSPDSLLGIQAPKGVQGALSHGWGLSSDAKR